MAISRRDWLIAAAAAAAGAAIPNSWANASQSDFVLLQKSPDASSLDALLVGGNAEIPSIPEASQGGVITTPRSTSLIYNFGVEVTEDNQQGCKYKFTLINSGDATMLNDKGYFITANSVVAGSEGANRFPLLWDPASGVIRIPRIVMYSNKSNLALGKIDVPEGFSIEPAYITKGDPAKGSMAYLIRYDPAAWASEKMIDDILGSTESVGPTCDLRQGNFTQTRPLKKRNNELGGDVLIAAVMDPAASGNPGYLVAAGDKPLREGEQGIALFSRNHDIIGVAQSPSVSAQGGDSRDNSFKFIGPGQVREMIKTYIQMSR